MIKNRLGFTLVELMVVVVIIGILAAVGIPQYNKITAQAKRTEAQLNLGTIFNNEQAYFISSQQTRYSAKLSEIGYQPIGSYNYNIGLTDDESTYGYCGGPAGKDPSSTKCKLMLGAGNEKPDRITNVGADVSNIANASNLSFKAAATAYIFNKSRDTFTVDQNKNLVHSEDGIQ